MGARRVVAFVRAFKRVNTEWLQEMGESVLIILEEGRMYGRHAESR